jgi:hypothetical protein
MLNSIYGHAEQPNFTVILGTIVFLVLRRCYPHRHNRDSAAKMAGPKGKHRIKRDENAWLFRGYN